MKECVACRRLFPEVGGAPSQVCPHCGHEDVSSPRVGEGPRRVTRADPVGAIEHALRLAPREYPRLLVAWSVALVLEIAVGFLVGVYASGADLLGPARTLTTTEQMRFLGVAVPLYLAYFTVRLALWSYAAARVLGPAVGGFRGRGFRASLGPALLMGFILTLTYAAGAMLLAIGFVVFLHWFLYAPAFLAKGSPTVGAAFEQSRRFARERSTAGFTALILFIGTPIVALYAWTGYLPGLAGVVVPALIAWFFGPLVPLLAASFVTVTEGRPGTVEAAGGARAPRVSTSCPRCRALIPYEPSATGPVDVVCASCGHAGRVL